MAYPLGHWTWDELIKELAEHGVTFHESGSLTSPIGHTSPIQYFEKGGKKPRRYAITFADRKEGVLPNTLRSLCSGLGLDPKDFGLELG